MQYPFCIYTNINCNKNLNLSSYYITILTKTQKCFLVIPQFQTELTPLSIYVGSVAQMECTPPFGKPIPKVLWLKDGKTFSDPRIEQGKTLKINDVKITDAANYTCVAMGFKNRTTTAELKVYGCKE